ncbi:MAG TPA: response regulator [Verrucomicrobiae bacterium]|nr:response regulator [Verrucomicrobiae bacterium]
MPKNRTILIADDSPDDLFLLRRSFQRAGVLNPVQEVRSGKEAIAYLKGTGPYADREKFPFPEILLLDLNMPEGDGFEVLQWIRDKLPVADLLIIVLSQLDELKSINRAYSLGANSFLAKPGDEQELHNLIKVFGDYWLVRNKPPKSGERKPFR